MTSCGGLPPDAFIVDSQNCREMLSAWKYVTVPHSGSQESPVRSGLGGDSLDAGREVCHSLCSQSSLARASAGADCNFHIICVFLEKIRHCALKD